MKLIPGKLRWISLIASLSIFILLTGCVKGDFHVTVNKDGSADLDYKLGMQAQLIGLMSGNGQNDPISELKTNFEKQGFSVSQYRDGDYIGVAAKKHLNNSEEIGNALPSQNILNQNQKSNSSEMMNFSQDKDFFFTTYRYNGSVDLTDMKPDDKDTMGIQQMMLKQIDLKLTLSLPVKADMQNASRVLPDQQTYQWDLIPGTKGEVILQAKVPNITNIMICSIALLLIIGVIVVTFIKNRQRKAAASLSSHEPPLSLE